MKVWKQKPLRLVEKELTDDLGKENFIFVGSSTDMFAKDVPEEWIAKVLNHCAKHQNKYLFQTKSPARLLHFNPYLISIVVNNVRKIVLGTTIETNRFYKEFMGNAPKPVKRAESLSGFLYPKMVTIEPILDFDLEPLVEIIKSIDPEWVNIGADSKGHKMPEPSKEKVLTLISELKKFTDVKIKDNLKRIIR